MLGWLPLGVLRFSQTKAEKVPLNLIEVILAQGSLSKERRPVSAA